MTPDSRASTWRCRKVNGQWIAEDLGSKNGTLVNDRRIEGATPVGVGDKIVAGHLELELSAALPGAAIQKVVFVEAPESSAAGSTTVVASLDAVLGTQSDEMNKTSIIQGNPQMRALIRAGRELAGHRPLEELFTVIMDLSVEAVMAGRGVLMTLEGDELKVRAARGAGLKFRPQCANACFARRNRCWSATRSWIRRCAST